MDKFEQYLLRDVPERFHFRLLQSHRRLGAAALELQIATEEYQQAIQERLALNQEIRDGNY